MKPTHVQYGLWRQTIQLIDSETGEIIASAAASRTLKFVYLEWKAQFPQYQIKPIYKTRLEK